MKSMVLITALTLTLAVANTVAVYNWWNYNRMAIPCLLLGVWGDGGPGFESYLDHHESKQTTPNAPGRSDIVSRHWTQNICAPADESMHWRLVEKIATERDWPEAHFQIALKLGYGNFYGGPTYVAGFLREDLGDGKNLDLAKSFALLQKSAAQGYYLAQLELAQAYRTGAWGKNGEWRIETDLAKALSLLDDAAAQGDNVESHFAPYFNINSSN